MLCFVQRTSHLNRRPQKLSKAKTRARREIGTRRKGQAPGSGGMGHRHWAVKIQIRKGKAHRDKRSELLGLRPRVILKLPENMCMFLEIFSSILGILKKSSFGRRSPILEQNEVIPFHMQGLPGRVPHGGLSGDGRCAYLFLVVPLTH